MAILETYATEDHRMPRHIGQRLRRLYGRGRWRKRKGVATVRLDDGFVAEAELHWYDATGVGKKELGIKRLLR